MVMRTDTSSSLYLKHILNRVQPCLVLSECVGFSLQKPFPLVLPPSIFKKIPLSCRVGKQNASKDAKWTLWKMLICFFVKRSYYTLEERMEHTLEEVTKDSPLDATVTTWCLLWTLPHSLPPLEEPLQPQWMSPPGAALDILPPPSTR